MSIKDQLDAQKAEFESLYKAQQADSAAKFAEVIADIKAIPAVSQDPAIVAKLDAIQASIGPVETPPPTPAPTSESDATNSPTTPSPSV